MTSEWIDAKNENVIDLNDEIDHQYKKKTKSQISKPPKPTGRGKSKTKEEEVQGNQNIPSDPYRLIENPQQKCCREDHIRKKNCKDDPWCLFGIVNTDPSPKNKALMFKDVDLDKTVENHYLKFIGDNELFLNYRTREDISLAGIKNLGATCYINVFLQSMFNNPLTRNAILVMLQIGSGNDQSNLFVQVDGASVVNELQSVLFELLAGRLRAVETFRFISKMEVSAHIQQDPHEFQNLLLDKLKEIEGAFHARNANEVRKQSLRDIFRHSVDDCTECSRCHAVQRNVQHSYDLQIATNKQTSNSTINLAAAIAQYQQKEELSNENKYFCQSCNQYSCAIKQLQITELSDVLCVQLLRYNYDKASNSRVKTSNAVVFPHELTIPVGDDETSNGDKRSVELKLVGAVYHLGNSAHGGHYVCDVLQWSGEEHSNSTETWYHCDDESTYPIDASTVTSQWSDSVGDDDLRSSSSKDTSRRKFVDLSSEESQQLKNNGSSKRFNRQKSVYLLYYVNKELYEKYAARGAGYENSRALVAQQIKQDLDARNQQLDSSRAALLARIESLKNEITTRKDVITQIEESLSSPTKNDTIHYNIISSEFLTKYLTGDPLTFKSISESTGDSTETIDDIYCVHSRLCWRKIAQCKVIPQRILASMLKFEPHLERLLAPRKILQSNLNTIPLTNQNYRCCVCFEDLVHSKQKLSGEFEDVGKLLQKIEEYKEKQFKVRIAKGETTKLYFLAKDFIKQLGNYQAKLQKLLSEKKSKLNKTTKKQSQVIEIDVEKQSNQLQQTTIDSHFTADEDNNATQATDNIAEIRNQFFHFLNLNHSLVCSVHLHRNDSHRAIVGAQKKSVIVDEALFNAILRWFGRGHVEEIACSVDFDQLREYLKEKSSGRKKIVNVDLVDGDRDVLLVGAEDLRDDFFSTEICCRDCMQVSQERSQREVQFTQMKEAIEQNESLCNLFFPSNKKFRERDLLFQLMQLLRNTASSSATTKLYFVDGQWLRELRALLQEKQVSEDSLERHAANEFTNKRICCAEHGMLLGPSDLESFLTRCRDEVSAAADEEDAYFADIVGDVHKVVRRLCGEDDLEEEFDGVRVELVTEEQWQSLLLHFAPEKFLTSSSENAADDDDIDGIIARSNVFHAQLTFETISRELRTSPRQCLACVREKLDLAQMKRSCFSNAHFPFYKLENREMEVDHNDSRYIQSLQFFLENPKLFLATHEIAVRDKDTRNHDELSALLNNNHSSRRRSRALRKVQVPLSDEDDIYMVKLKLCEFAQDVLQVKRLRIFDQSGQELRDYSKSLREYQILRGQALFYTEAVRTSKKSGKEKNSNETKKSKGKKRGKRLESDSDGEESDRDDASESDELLELYLQSKQTKSRASGRNGRAIEKAFEDSFLSSSKQQVPREDAVSKSPEIMIIEDSNEARDHITESQQHVNGGRTDTPVKAKRSTRSSANEDHNHKRPRRTIEDSDDELNQIIELSKIVK